MKKCIYLTGILAFKYNYHVKPAFAHCYFPQGVLKISLDYIDV